MKKLRPWKQALQAFGKNQEDEDAVIDAIYQERWIIVLDAIAMNECVDFTKNWLTFNAPAYLQSPSREVMDFLMEWRASFMVMTFHPDSLSALWGRIRDADHANVLRYLVELLTHLRSQVFANTDELEELIAHNAEALTYIHTSDRHLIDNIAPRDAYVTDDQFIDELPTMDNVVDQLNANPWILPLIYCHRFTVEQFDEFHACIVKQTQQLEKSHPSAAKDSVEQEGD